MREQEGTLRVLLSKFYYDVVDTYTSFYDTTCEESIKHKNNNNNNNCENIGKIEK